MGKSKKLESDEWIIIISKRLKELRKEMGYSSYENFALDHDLDRKQYWRVENGSNITIRTLIRILTVHKKGLPEFFKEIKNPKRNISK
jgi:transcriptional regulator with XRE-family HTH domain